MEAEIENTGIVRKVRRRAENLADVETLVADYNAGWNIDKRLAEISEKGRNLMAPYLAPASEQYSHGGHRYGELVADAEPTAFDARDVLPLVENVKTFLKNQGLPVRI